MEIAWHAFQMLIKLWMDHVYQSQFQNVKLDNMLVMEYVIILILFAQHFNLLEENAWHVFKDSEWLVKFAFKFNVLIDMLLMCMETVNKSVHFVKFIINLVFVLIVLLVTVLIQQENVFNKLLLIHVLQGNILVLIIYVMSMNIATPQTLGTILVQVAQLDTIFYILDSVFLKSFVNKDNTSLIINVIMLVLHVDNSMPMMENV